MLVVKILYYPPCFQSTVASVSEAKAVCFRAR